MKSDIFIDTECEFCGQIKTCATSPIGVYCKECWELIKEMAEDGMEVIDKK